jgi:hypothetical protein
VDSAINVYVADTANHTIRKVTSSGVVNSPAGSAGNYGCADGTNRTARFYRPTGVAGGIAGNLFVTDLLDHTLRKIRMKARARRF